jgi:hypothetical protein
MVSWDLVEKRNKKLAVNGDQNWSPKRVEKKMAERNSTLCPG